MQQLSGSSGRGGTLIPSTSRIFSGGGPGLEAGPARRDPNMMRGVGGTLAPVVRLASSSMRAASCSCFCFSSTIVGNGFDSGGDEMGCCIDTRISAR